MRSQARSARIRAGHAFLRIAGTALAWAIALPAPAADRDSPRERVQRFHEALIQTMKDGPEIGYEGRFQRLEPVVRDTFALGFMARKSVGRAWDAFREEDRAAYLSIYVEWSVATFAGRFKNWSGERFEILSESSAGGTVTVDSRLIKKDGEPVSFRYKLREGDVGWRVVDLHLDGVSQLALTRSQYTEVLKQDGVDGLLGTLQQKIEEQRAGVAE
jgi:phospholipid transport system substrate-binding protein